jgi:hypothetical protein
MRRRIITILLVFVAAVILTVIATLTPMTQQNAVATNNDINQTVNTMKANDALLQYIYGQNFMITMLLFVPFIGPVLGFVTFYNTGVALGAEFRAQVPSVPPPLVFSVEFIDPIFWLEFVSYSIAIAGGIWLSARILQGSARHEIRNTAKFISVCAVLLLISAVIEATLIYASS